MEDWFPYYSFHIALFMFCSGYFYKLDSHEHTLQFIWKKIKRLLIPLFLWNLFYAGFVLFISNFGFKIGLPLTLEKLTTGLITSGHQLGFNMGGWFVIPLFMCLVFTVLLRKILSKWNCRAKEWILTALYICFGVLGIFLARQGWGSGQPSWALVVTRMLALMPYFGVGILYKTVLEKYDTLKNWVYFTIIIVLQLIVIGRSNGTVPGGTPSWSNYPATVSPIICGFTGIAFYLRITRILEPVLGKNKIINKIADSTYAIMIHQFLGFWLVTLAFGLLTAITHSGNFNWDKFQSSIWYKYYPSGQWHYGIIYIVAGITIPLLLQKLLVTLLHLFSNKQKIQSNNKA